MVTKKLIAGTKHRKILYITFLITLIVSMLVTYSYQVNVTNAGTTPKYDYKDKRAPSTSPPGGLSPSKVPQFVTIGFDDNFISGMPGSKYTGGMAWAIDTFKKRNASATFFVNTRYIVQTDKVEAESLKVAWKKAYDSGNEIGNHTHSHINGETTNASLNTWVEEINKARDLLKSIGIPYDKIIGFRTPYFAFNKDTHPALKKTGIMYDTSLSDGHQKGVNGKNLNWPYTLDNGPSESQSNHGVGKASGLWIVPHHVFVAPPDDKCKKYGVPSGLRAKMKKAAASFNLDTGITVGSDYTMWNTYKLNKSEFLAILKYTLDLRLEGNRAPMTPCFHSNRYSSFEDTDSDSAPNATSEEMKQMVEEFLDYASSKPEVKIVNIKQILDWVKNPVALK